MRARASSGPFARRTMKPPTDINPSELFQRLRERPAPSDVFAFPRCGDDGEPLFDVRIFVLTDAKLEVCRRRGRAWLAEETKGDSETSRAVTAFDEQRLGDRLARELLAEAVFEDRIIGEGPSGPVYVRLFRNANDVSELTEDEIGALYGAYLLTQVRFGPTNAVFADQRDVNAWVERLASGARPFLLTLLQSHQRDELLLSLAQRASSIASILATPPENWQTSLESLRTNWRLGTDSSTPPVVDASPSPDESEVITKERAMEIARTLRRSSGL